MMPISHHCKSPSCPQLRNVLYPTNAHMFEEIHFVCTQLTRTRRRCKDIFSARFQRSFRSHRRDTDLVEGVQLMCAELMAIYVIQFAGLPNGIMLFKGRWYPTPNGVHELDAVTKTPLLRRGLVWETREPFISPELVQSQIVIIKRPDIQDRDVVLDRDYDSMIPLVHE